MSVSRIVNNISAVNANRNLDKTGRGLQKSIERLSSGLRINRAGDDAAGLSVANRLKTQVEGLNQAITNASDGINLINVAEGALEETTARLNRIRQLAIQAANTGVNDMPARRALQDEVFQSIDEITRIANTTQFGSNYLLNGDFSIKTELIKGQQNIGLSIDASPVASTLASGKSFINIIKIQQGSSQIISGEEGTGQPQVINMGIRIQTDFAVSMAYFSGDNNFRLALDGADGLRNAYFNGVSIVGKDTFVFEGVLADGVTKFTGTFSVGGATATVTRLGEFVQLAIDSAEKALFGVNTTSSIPTAYRTTISAGTGDNKGRLVMSSQGSFINQSSISFNLVRNAEIVTRALGVTRSGAIGVESSLSGTGAVGNNITAITGSTFGVGQFEITVKDVQAAQQRKTESSVIFRDQNGAVINRLASLYGNGAVGGTQSLVLNGTFVGGVYTGGTSIMNGDVIILNGTNVDGTTFEGKFTFQQASAASATLYDTTLNDFRFSSISGLIMEMNYRTRDYYGNASGIKDGVQSRFEDAMFTFTSSGKIQLIDDVGRSNSQTTFTLTFQGNPNRLSRENYTIQDDAYLAQEGFAEQATFRIEGGEEIRAEAGQVITLVGPKATKEGVPQSRVTMRVGSGLTAGTDKLETTPDKYTGTLNGGQKVTFGNGDQDVVFVDGNSGGNRGVARFVTVDFDNIIEVTARTDGLPDAGTTLIISTTNSSLNFHIGAQAFQAFRASIGDLTSENLGFGRGSGRAVANIDITSIAGANEAILIVDEALSQVNKTRSILGAATNRMESAINNLSVSAENLTASESRIRDADIARESTTFTKNQVLQQAGLSVLAQANFQSQGFLSLLG